MKKQILLLIVAFMASLTVAWAQKAVNSTDARSVTCSNDGLNPIAGVPYKYSAAISPAGGTAFWHVVYQPGNLITNSIWTATDQTIGGPFISAATGLGSNVNAASPTETTITWKTGGLATVDDANRLIVAIEYAANPATGCANNLQVLEIRPKNAFTIDITTMKADGTSSNVWDVVESQCYSPIASSVYNPGAAGAPGTVKMDYGVNTMYFEVIAANFTENFKPSFQLSGLQAGQTAELFWGYTALGATNSMGTAANGATVGPITAETDATDTSLGVSIYVKVVINNNGYEGLTTDRITLAVEAVNSANQPDVLADCTVPTTPFEDKADQELRLRPTVNNPLPSPFLIKN